MAPPKSSTDWRSESPTDLPNSPAQAASLRGQSCDPYTGNDNVAKLLDGIPIIIVDEGVPLEQRMRKARLDVMEAARMQQGIERLDQIKFAILEKNGGISIIPKSGT